MEKKEWRGLISTIIIISLVVGAIGGTFGSFFLKPYLEKTQWGKNFLSAPENLAGDKKEETSKIYKVAEDSTTVEVVKKASVSVVSVVVSKELDMYNMTGPDVFDFMNPENSQPNNGGRKLQQIGGGTGFVIDADGLILTNRHVVEDDTAAYTVVFNDGKKYSAKIIARDTVNDFAVLKVEANNLPVAQLGDSDQLQIGQTVIAIGNSLGEYGNSVTRGVVSGINRKIVAGGNGSGSEVLEEAIQTDAAINPGNSGGPLLNLMGQVIGINTAVNWQGRSIGFAIPINQAKSAIESVKTFGKIIRPWIGVRYLEVNEDLAQKNNLKYNYGAILLKGASDKEPAVMPDSPAARVGLQERDIILAVNGQKLDSEHSLLREVNKYKPGDEIELKIFHKDAEKTIKVKLEERK